MTISALTVAVSLSALLVFPQYFLRSFAYAGIAVVLLAMVASIVSLPALLAVVGTRIDSLRVFRAGAQPARTRTASGTARRRGSCAARSPSRVAVVAVLLLLGAAVPARAVRHPRRPGAARVGAGPRGRPRSLRDDFAGNTSESFPVVVEDVDGAVDDGADGRGDAGVGARRCRPGRDGRRHVRRRCSWSCRRDRTRRGTPIAGVGWMAVVPSIEMASAEGEDLVAEIRSLDAGGRDARRRADRRARRHEVLDRRPTAAGAGDHRRRDVRPAVPPVGQRARADQGAGAQPAQPHGHVRRDGVDLPGRQPVGPARLHRDRCRSTRRRRS